MIYFHHSSCISPQDTFGEPDCATLHKSVDNWLTVREPDYKEIPRGMLRRMGKAVRIGVGTAMPLVTEPNKFSGIIIGTANGGMEDCIKFLNQIIEFDEGTLTPTNFVQSTTNAIAGQIGLMSENTGYNATHVHRGVAFEQALLDAFFLSSENVHQQFLVGGIDEISTYNYNIDLQAGWYKSEKIESAQLYLSQTKGSLAGEGSAFFGVSASPEKAVMKLAQLKTVQTTDVNLVQQTLQDICNMQPIDVVISGENGDLRQSELYDLLDQKFENSVPIYRYKHLCGEYPTSVAFAVWLCFEAFKNKKMPSFLQKKNSVEQLAAPKNILIYNNYQGLQHSFLVLSLPMH